MSLILDALRKAEAERQRGAVPGLHSPVAAPPARPAPVRRAPPVALGLGVLTLLGLAGAAAWWWSRPAAAPLAPPPALAAAPGPGAPAGQPPAPAPWPLVVSAPTDAPAAQPPAAPAAPAVAARTAATPAPILTQVRRLAELAPEQRRELPPLVVGGSVWSEQASARFVVLDGQVLREGEAAAPGLVLVKLAPRSATLRWRDTLIEVPF